MSSLEGMSLKVRNFKCFGNEPQGFEEIKPFNIIIGRNNSGKSSLLELLWFEGARITNAGSVEWHKNRRPEIQLTCHIPTDAITRVFPPKSRARWGRYFRDSHQLLEDLKKITVTWTHRATNKGEEIRRLADTLATTQPLNENANGAEYAKSLAELIVAQQFGNNVFLRANAERDVKAEKDFGKSFELRQDGRGTTNHIHHFINKAGRPRWLVEQRLLDDLNRIYHPDASFSEILCRQDLKDEEWEIYLVEDSKGEIALSRSGSGLRTVIQLLANVLLVPRIKGDADETGLSGYILLCEEPENNLHPAVLRRLLMYLYERTVENRLLVFITTHSSVAIDLFSHKNDAQIVHVTHDGTSARCETVTTYLHQRGVLDDLEIRASDLLQANGIIWVEGPSDRTLINRWIELRTNGRLVEGLHYQCVVYGGVLRSHWTANDPDEAAEQMSILRTNRNVCMVADSDKKDPDDQINTTKQRLDDEVTKLGGMSWITEGREIENYLPANAIAQFLEHDTVEQVQRHESFLEYLDRLEPSKGEWFKRNKPKFAKEIAPLLEAESCFAVLDLRKNIDELCGRIRRWNGISETQAVDDEETDHEE